MENLYRNIIIVFVLYNFLLIINCVVVLNDLKIYSMLLYKNRNLF